MSVVQLVLVTTFMISPLIPPMIGAGVGRVVDRVKASKRAVVSVSARVAHVETAAATAS